MLLLTGPSGSGKTAFVLDRFREAVRSGRSDCRIVVPTATLVEHLRNECAREGLVFRPELITTFSKLASALAPGVEQVSAPLFHAIVQQCLAETPVEFSAVADAPGFPAAVAQTLDWLDSLGCAPEALLRVKAEAPLASALAAIWSSVNAELTARCLVTRAGLLHRAAPSPEIEEFWFDGFGAFSDPELSLVSALSASGAVVITLPEDTAAAVCKTRLLAMGAEHRMLPAPLRRTVPTHRFAADSIEREADEIARRILAHGEPFREIGVALRNPERYSRVLQATFERFGIPARFYFASKLMENAASRFLADTIDTMLSGWDHERAACALRLLPRTPSLDRFDFQLREQFPGRGLDALGSLQPGEPVKGLLAQWRRIDIWRERKIPAYKWANALASLQSLFPSTNRVQATALEHWSAALDEAAAWWTDRERAIPLTEFWPIAKSVLRLTQLRINDKRRNVVHVMSLHEARQWDLDLIFLCGMAEKDFPRRHAQNAFLPDAAIRRLQKFGLRVPTSADRDEEEEPLFTAVQNGARHQLVMSYAADDQNLPSVFFGRGENADKCAPVRPAPLTVPGKQKGSGGIVSADLFPILQQRTERLSVTGLESYLQCPFQFFAGKTLKLKEAPQRPEERLDNLQTGSIVHQVLAEWYNERPPITEVFEKIFTAKCEQLRIPPSYRREMLRERMRGDLERFAKNDRWPRGNPALMEEQIQIRLSEDAVVHARIDRLETLPDGSVVIVDYKYSNAKNTRDKVDDETKLQGPLYVYGVENGRHVSAMVYYSLRRDSDNVEPRPFGWGVVPGLHAKLEDMTQEWLDQGVYAARRAVVELRAGRLLPAPAKLANCRFCDFRDACRYEAAAAVAVGIS